MPSNTEITTAQLSRLIGLPDSPVLIDVRNDEDFRDNPRLLPGSYRRDSATVSNWAHEFQNRTVIVSCQKCLKLSQGVAAWLRHEGINAQTLEGGFDAWRGGGQLLVNTDKLPARDEN